MLLLCLVIVEAEFNPEEASNWLSTQKTDNIFEKSFQSLALMKYNPLVASNLASEIKKAGTDCWPSNSCNVRDTALALMALQRSEESIKLDWLLDKQIASLSGNWFLQIDTPSSGTCTIKDEDATYTITVSAGKLSTNLCKTPTAEFDLNTCLKPNLLSEPSKQLEVDCPLAVTPYISLLHQDGTSYYVFAADHTKKQTISVNNGYFSDVESTLYTNWVLKYLGSKINSLTWLKKNYNSNNVVHLSLLYLITENKYFLTALVELQDQTEGNFGTEFETAVATLALAKSKEYNSALEKAYEWLGEKQVDGSINGDLLDTSVALYSFGISEGGITIPTCTSDAECSSGYHCKNGECTKKEITPTVCIVNNECELGENCENCPADCLKTGEVCCNDIAYKGKCCTDLDCGTNEECISHECKAKELPKAEKSSAVFWVLFIILIIAFLIFIYYTQFYKKGRSLSSLFKKKPSKPTRPIYQPRPTERIRIPITTPQRPIIRKSRVEEELEKSLEEARKLLKK